MGPIAASRLLTQGTFGPTIDTIAATSAQTYDQWFAEQAAIQPSLTYPDARDADPNVNPYWIRYWWRNTVLGPDQLRQRMAFALSQIFVISQKSAALDSQNQAVTGYYDILVQNGLGNFRDVLEKVTLSLQMGVYLNMYHSSKQDASAGIHADQNFAREVMQLFTIGTVQLTSSGQPKYGNNGRALATYGYTEVEGLANALTGWASAPTTHTDSEGAYLWDYDFSKPMVGYENHHDTGAKTIVRNTTIPAGGTTATDLKIALDTLFNHTNTPPFICKQLIQRLVTSNPSPAYVRRVANVFKDNGMGVRGDLLAVAKAILTDSEATRPGSSADGKLREPVLRYTNLFRAFDGHDRAGAVSESGLYWDAQATSGEVALNAPSVFNFYQTDYTRAGPLTDAGMVAPEFQITNENTLVQMSNRLQTQAYQYVDAKGKIYSSVYGDNNSQYLGDDSVLLHTAQWEAFAGNPARLIDRMNQVLMQGLMPADMKSLLLAYITEIPTTEKSFRARRVVEAADLIINSPQYAVQR